MKLGILNIFSTTLFPEENIKRGDGTWATDVLFNVKTERRTSVFGSSYFEGGSDGQQLVFQMTEARRQNPF